MSRRLVAMALALALPAVSHGQCMTGKSGASGRAGGGVLTTTAFPGRPGTPTGVATSYVGRGMSALTPGATATSGLASRQLQMQQMMMQSLRQQQLAYQQMMVQQQTLAQQAYLTQQQAYVAQQVLTQPDYVLQQALTSANGYVRMLAAQELARRQSGLSLNR